MKKLILFLVAISMAHFSMFAQTVEFSDDFESGTSNWTLEGTWDLTTAQSNSPSNSLTDSPGGNYAADLEISAAMTTGVDLSAALDAELNFSAIYDIEGGNFDYCYVDISTDGGATWVTIYTFLGEGNLTPWVDYNLSLGGFVGNSDVRVRFHLSTDGGFEVDGIYIDDVEIISSDVDNGAPLVLHTAPTFYESAASDIVMVADLIDVSGITSATLWYSVDGGSAMSVAGDNVSGDTYTFLIPEQAAGAQVDYFIEAVDASPNANAASTTTWSYISGTHIFYDNAVVDFVNSFGPDAASLLTACAVRFTLFDNDIKYALIRNYTDVNRPNDDFEFHIWANDNGLPGADLITPFMVTPEATLENSSPMTRVDLSAYAAELSGITGDVFMGYSVPAGETWLGQTTPAIGNRTYVFDGTTWAFNADDYHFRLVTTMSSAADDCADATDLNSLVGGGFDNTQTSPLFDNTDATVAVTDPTVGYDCWSDEDDEGNFLSNTQWYTFTGDGNSYKIESNACGAVNFIEDTQFAIYSGDDCDNLTPVACNDDVSAAVYTSVIFLETEVDVTYYLFVDGWDGAVGEYCIEFTEVSIAEAAADDCADATDLNDLFGGGPGNLMASTLYTNADATVSETDPTVGFECWFELTVPAEAVNNNQWFTFTGDGLLYQVNSGNCGTENPLPNNDTQFALYSGDDCGNLTAIACNDDLDPNSDLSSILNVQTEDGVTYYLMVDGYNGGTGEYCIEITELVVITCAEIAIGDDATITTMDLCDGESATLSLAGTTVIPALSNESGFLWVVSSADISGSTDPAADASYLGGFGTTPEPGEVTFDTGFGLPAGTYFFTPVVYGNALNTGGLFSDFDLSEGCALAGQSLQCTIHAPYPDLSATSSFVDEINPPGSNGEASVAVTGGSDSYTYLWSNAETTASITGLSGATYTVTISDASGCVDEVVVDIVVGTVVAVEDLEFQQSVHLFPNPAKNQTVITYDFTESMDLNVSMTNSLGQLVFEQQMINVQKGQLDLNLQEFTDGIYFVNLSNGENQTTRRLVITK